jgi:hypothetical protein
MAELTVSNLIKLIIGILVFVVVVGGVYLFFKERIIGYFRSIFGTVSTKFILILF